MTQQVKVNATKPEDKTLNPRIHIRVEEEN